MDDQLQHILSQHEKECEGWYENIRDYQEQFILPYNPYWDDIASEPIYMEALLRRLLEIFISYAGKRDTWEWHESLEYGTGFSTGIIAERIERAYFLGADKDSIYLESPVLNRFLRMSIYHRRHGGKPDRKYEEAGQMLQSMIGEPASFCGPNFHSSIDY